MAARPSGFEQRRRARRGKPPITSDGLLVVADNVFQQIVLLGYEGSAQATSLPLDCGHPGVDKAFVSLTWSGDTGEAGTKIGLEYRLGSGSWRPCTFRSGLRRYDFKAGTHGKTIAYRVTLSTTNRSLDADPGVHHHPVDEGQDGRRQAAGAAATRRTAAATRVRAASTRIRRPRKAGRAPPAPAQARAATVRARAPAPGAPGPARPARAPAPVRPPRRRPSTCRSSPPAAAPPWPSRATRSRARRA